MECSGAWLIPELSLQSEAHQEIDRRLAARLDKGSLHALADDLIIQWYQHRSIIDKALGRVRQLEVQLALAEAPPSDARVSDAHLAMAREVMAAIGVTPSDLGCDDDCGDTRSAPAAV